jgi:nitrogen PTS system EIIA component
MDIGDWLDRSAIAHRSSADSKRQALAAVAEVAARTFARPGQVPFKASEVFVRLDEPVAFDALDDQPVDLLFALFAPENATTEHLRALARVSRLLRSDDMRKQLRAARTADAIQAILRQDAEANAA